jgi:UDP-N-acetylglucosamine--N-acetylmuramyl-(pentapeptide) pyrophosphoryl-undecaprenol N-acetylglucosamine transferase
VAILIPSPNVAENHQYHNAMALVNNRAAFMIEEKNLSGKALMQTIEKLLCNKNKYIEYQTNVKKMAVTDANERIYKIVKDTIKA